MKFSAQLDVNVVAPEADDEVALLLDLEAPATPDEDPDRPRAGSSLQIVQIVQNRRRGRLSSQDED